MRTCLCLTVTVVSVTVLLMLGGEMDDDLRFGGDNIESIYGTCRSLDGDLACVTISCVACLFSVSESGTAGSSSGKESRLSFGLTGPRLLFLLTVDCFAFASDRKTIIK
jgi:hypothetical protein